MATPRTLPGDFEKFFGALVDPRLERRKHYPLLHVLFIALCGVFMGATGPTAMAELAHAKRSFFERFFPLPYGTPSKSVFDNVLSRLDPVAFREAFEPWAQRLMADLSARHLAGDGKALRGALEAVGSTLHRMHLWAVDERVLVSLEKVKGAPGETQGLEAMLSTFDLDGAVLSLDANGCSKAVAKNIVEHGGDYLLALKGNRGPLYRLVVEHFEQLQERNFRGGVRAHHETDRSHGRLVQRHVHTTSVAFLPLASHQQWTHLRSVTRVERVRTVKGKTKVERHYFLSSLPPEPERLGTLIRNHWSVENQLHWVLDVTMNEDDSIHHPTLAENVGLLRRMVVSRLGRPDTGKRSLKMKMLYAAANDDFLLQLLRWPEGLVKNRPR